MAHLDRMKRGHSGARCNTPKLRGAVMRNNPEASELRAVISDSASAMPASSSFARP